MLNKYGIRALRLLFNHPSVPPATKRGWLTAHCGRGVSHYSLLHMACAKNLPGVAKFLLDEAVRQRVGGGFWLDGLLPLAGRSALLVRRRKIVQI